MRSKTEKALLNVLSEKCSFYSKWPDFMLSLQLYMWALHNFSRDRVAHESTKGGSKAHRKDTFRNGCMPLSFVFPSSSNFRNELEETRLETFVLKLIRFYSLRSGHCLWAHRRILTRAKMIQPARNAKQKSHVKLWWNWREGDGEAEKMYAFWSINVCNSREIFASFRTFSRNAWRI